MPTPQKYFGFFLYIFFFGLLGQLTKLFDQAVGDKFLTFDWYLGVSYSIFGNDHQEDKIVDRKNVQKTGVKTKSQATQYNRK